MHGDCNPPLLSSSIATRLIRAQRGSQEGRHGDSSAVYSRALLEHPACHLVGWNYHSWPLGQENQGAEDKGGLAHSHDPLAPAPQQGRGAGTTGRDRWRRARLHLLGGAIFRRASGRNVDKNCPRIKCVGKSCFPLRWLPNTASL